MKPNFKYTCLLLAILLGTTGGWAQVTIGSDKDPEKGALLDFSQNLDGASGDGLENSQKGVLLSRVSLQSLSSLAPLVNSPTPKDNSKHKGAIVYNVTVDLAKGLREGLYCWDGMKWDALVIDIPKNSVRLTNLSGSDTDRESTEGQTDGTGGKELPFAPAIIIPEDGSYAFSFRLYGELTGWKTWPNDSYDPQRIVFYLSLWEKNDSQTNMRDITEIDLYVARFEKMYHYTYSITMAAELKKGSQILFKLAHISGKTPWLLYGSEGAANRTSMIWWKM